MQTYAIYIDYPGARDCGQGDRLTIYDSGYTTNKMRTLCGSGSNVRLESSGNSMYVQFDSNSHLQSTGFTARYTRRFKPTPPPTLVPTRLFVNPRPGPRITTLLPPAPVARDRRTTLPGKGYTHPHAATSYFL